MDGMMCFAHFCLSRCFWLPIVFVHLDVVFVVISCFIFECHHFVSVTSVTFLKLPTRGTQNFGICFQNLIIYKFSLFIQDPRICFAIRNMISLVVNNSFCFSLRDKTYKFP